MLAMIVAEFNFDGFSVDMTRSMVAMRDVSFPPHPAQADCTTSAQYLLLDTKLAVQFIVQWLICLFVELLNRLWTTEAVICETENI